MKKLQVPIFTEEYKIEVVIGKVEELAKYVTKNCEGWTYEGALDHSRKTRGSAYDRLNHGTEPKHPLITLDIDLPYSIALATLPHEACHCADYIFQYTGIQDDSGELRAHIVSAVVRQTLKKLLGKKEFTVK